jgi:hypothetical protein
MEEWFSECPGLACLCFGDRAGAVSDLPCASRGVAWDPDILPGWQAPAGLPRSPSMELHDEVGLVDRCINGIQIFCSFSCHSARLGSLMLV